MRIIYSFVLALFLTPIFGVSQIYDPVDWSFSKQKISENTYELTFVADIEQGWAIYSNDIYNNDIDCDVEICPLPVSFEFDKDNDLESYYLIGGIKEVDENKSVSQDPIFLMDDTKCLPPTDVEFEFNFGEPTKNNFENNEVNIQNIEESNLNLYGFLPEQIKEQSSECDTENETVIENKDNSLLSIFLLGILGGFLALLTPCVFPMIPLTVSFFTKKNENDNGISNAILYGFFIFLVYIILSIPFHLLDSVNPDILNDISTNIYLNVLFFLVFLVFDIGNCFFFLYWTDSWNSISWFTFR